jgi:pimeloyl-ACP methyl ester carboxylesterase
VPTIRAAVLTLDLRPETRSGHTALAGFSFGAPQAVIASTHPSLDGHLHGVVGFGGYAELPRTLRFFFTGEHEWHGRSFRTPPDPYGRWLVGANYLTLIPEHREAGDVEEALWRLASEAGERQVISWSKVYDPLKRELRTALAPERRPVFDLFAPPSDREPPGGPEVDAMVQALSRTLDRVSPLLDPRPYLDRVRVPVRLIHGRHDHLIPFTETLRLRDAFPVGADVEADVSALFAHSGESGPGSPIRTVGEGLRFLGILRNVLSMA